MKVAFHSAAVDKLEESPSGLRPPIAKEPNGETHEIRHEEAEQNHAILAIKVANERLHCLRHRNDQLIDEEVLGDQANRSIADHQD